MADLSGQYLGRYYLAERLGEGGMAIVYKAYDTRLERDVAIKIIRSGAFPADATAELLKRFEREAKSLAKLSHPNIVKVHDYGEHEGSPYFVMEYLPGGTLKKLLVSPIPWQEALRILLPIARSVAYAHQRGILHRDIKPANILITESGEPMLSDFGIAKLFEADRGTALTSSGMAIGTPEYMAPEQWTGTTSPQSDLYSLGIVLYEMMTGRKPYMADTPAAILIKQATEPLPSPRKFVNDLPEPLNLVLIKALARDPRDRYKDLQAFIDALENLRADISVVPATEPKRVEEPGGTHQQKPDILIVQQTSPQDDETVHAVVAKKPIVKEGIIRRRLDPFKFFTSGWRSVSAKRRNRILVISIIVLLASVAGVVLYSRLSAPPLFFSGVSDGEVQIYSLTGETATKITQTVGGMGNWSPVVNPGGIIFFTSNRTGKVEIFQLSTWTGELWQVTHTSDRAESWSPAIGPGATIFFTSNRTGKAEIFGFNTRTGELWQITHTPGQAESWSPASGSGANIFFTSDRTGKAEIFGFNAWTGELWQVTNTPGHAESWSPVTGSGADIYFTSNRMGKAEVFGFNTRTGELWQVTHTPGQAESWSPVVRGRKIYFTSDRSGMSQIYLLSSTEKPLIDFESWTRKMSGRSPDN